MKPKRGKFFSLLFFYGGLLLLLMIAFYAGYNIYIRAATACMTNSQVAADSRCLYIVAGQIYQKGSRSSPHYGHPCGTDVTSIIPSFHTSAVAQYLTPNFVASICPKTTSTPTPTVTPIPASPTSAPTRGPSSSPMPTTPAPTIANGNTIIALVLCPHGTGSCGDNATPNIGGNTNPLHQSRSVTVFVYDVNNALAMSKTGIVTYQSSSETFNGLIDMGSLSSGAYSIKIHMDGFLDSVFPGIERLTVGQTNTLPKISLIAGDVDKDNQLTIKDYNILSGCFGDKFATCGNTLTDINDDGVVDGVDFNILIREFSVQYGE